MNAHKHAALMRQYADDAAETDTPWERWEFRDNRGFWDACTMLTWHPQIDYRRKPEPQKTETRTYECWDAHGTLVWKEGTRILPTDWLRVPGEDKVCKVVL